MRPVDFRHLKWDNIKSGGSVGMLPKTAIELLGIKYYIKMSSYNIPHKVYGLESISEVIASRLAKILGIPCIECYLVHATVNKDGEDFNTHLCVSADYKYQNEVVYPFEDMYEINRMMNETPLEYTIRNGMSEQVYAMFIFDYIINNLDRHGANTEIRIPITGTGMKLAPLFDNGLSLCTTVDDSRIEGYYPPDRAQVNNYIGSRYLEDNLESVVGTISLNSLNPGHREVLFKGLETLINQGRMDTIWNQITRRYENARNICDIRD